MRRRNILVGLFFNSHTPDVRDKISKARSMCELPTFEELIQDYKRITPQLLRAVRHVSEEFEVTVEYRFSEKAGCRCRCSPGFRLFVPETRETTSTRRSMAGLMKFYAQKDGTVRYSCPNCDSCILAVPSAVDESRAF